MLVYQLQYHLSKFEYYSLIFVIVHPIVLSFEYLNLILIVHFSIPLMIHEDFERDLVVYEVHDVYVVILDRDDRIVFEHHLSIV